MSRRAIGPVDTIWLHMDRPNNLMVIDTVMFLEGEADWDRVVTVVREQMVGIYPVFRQRPVIPRIHVGIPHWEDDPDFDLARHLVRARLERGDEAELREYMEGFICQPLDRDHPLWQLHLIDGYDGGSVVFCRFHHALADGIALTRVLLSLTGDSPDADLTEAAAADPRPETTDDAGGTGDTGPEHPSAMLDGARRLAGAAGALAGGAAHLAMDLTHLLDPRGAVAALTQVQRTGGIVNKLLLGPKAHSPFSGTPGPGKHVVWSEAFDLDDVRRVGHLSDATVNDVLMAAMAGALKTYVTQHGGTPEDLYTMVPVNVRPLDVPLPVELGNQFALVLFKYPTSVRGPLARIAETKRRMDVIKHSPEVVVTFSMIRAIGGTGPEAERFLVDFFAGKAIGVTTNVPGPTAPRYLGGSRIIGMLGWVPGSGEQTLGVSIFTYDGTVRVGFKVDATLIPDPERLLEAFGREMGELSRVAQAV